MKSLCIFVALIVACAARFVPIRKGPHITIMDDYPHPIKRDYPEWYMEQEHQRFRREVDTMEQEHPMFRHEVDTMEQEHPRLLNEVDTMEQEHPSLVHEVDTMEQEHPSLVHEVDTMEQEHPRFRRQADTIFASGSRKVGDNGKVFGSLGQNDNGLYGKGGYEHNIFNDHRGKLDAQAHGTRVLGPFGDTSHLGSSLNWQNSNAKASVDVSRQIGGPTSYNAAAGARWPIGKNGDFSAQGFYSKTHGMRGDYGGQGVFNYRF